MRASWLPPSSCAAFYIEHTPAHGVPPNDWDEPNPALPYESSAAAIAASGLLNLAEADDDPRAIAHYRAMPCHPRYAARPGVPGHETPGWEGLLKHGMYHQRKGLGVDESVMWGDHFFLEALYRKVLHE
jgi:unsaturated chondroitin disaccharide hydrolase